MAKQPLSSWVRDRCEGFSEGDEITACVGEESRDLEVIGPTELKDASAHLARGYDHAAGAGDPPADRGGWE
jgi:hypothetical protein